MQNQGIIKKQQAIWSFVFLCLLLFDQSAKYLARDYFKNYNFVFSLPLPVWLIYCLYFVILCAMTYYVRKNFWRFDFKNTFAWVLIFAGAASNIGERLIIGYVKDFVYITLYGLTGVYNLADFYIIVGIIILLMQDAKHKAQNK